MAEGDETKAGFDVRLDWPEDELRDPSAETPLSSPSPPPPPAPPPTPSSASNGVDGNGRDVEATDGGLLGFIVGLSRQVDLLTAAVERGIADLRVDARENNALVRRLTSSVEEAGNDTTGAELIKLTGAIEDLQVASQNAAAVADSNGDADPDAAAATLAAISSMEESIVGALGEVLEELVQLRRRIAVRPASSRAKSGLSADDLELIVDGVVQRLTEIFEVPE